MWLMRRVKDGGKRGEVVRYGACVLRLHEERERDAAAVFVQQTDDVQEVGAAFVAGRNEGYGSGSGVKRRSPGSCVRSVAS